MAPLWGIVSGLAAAVASVAAAGGRIEHGPWAEGGGHAWPQAASAIGPQVGHGHGLRARLHSSAWQRSLQGEQEHSQLSLPDLLPFPAVGQCPGDVVPVCQPVDLPTALQQTENGTIQAAGGSGSSVTWRTRGLLSPALAAAYKNITAGLLTTVNDPSQAQAQSGAGQGPNGTQQDTGGPIVPGATLRITYKGQELLAVDVGQARTEVPYLATKPPINPMTTLAQQPQAGDKASTGTTGTGGGTQYTVTVPVAPMPVTGDTVWRVGSVTKMFTAAALFGMAQEGLVGLHDQVGDWVPGFGVLAPGPVVPLLVTTPDQASNKSYSNPGPGAEKPSGSGITFAHLAGHTSGLPRLVGSFWNISSTDEALAWLRNSHLLFQPGSQVSYSNIGYALLGNILAEYVHPRGPRYNGYQRAGRPGLSQGKAGPRSPSVPSSNETGHAGNGPVMTYPRLLQRYVFGPAGMSHSGLDYSTAEVQSRLAFGYNATGHPVQFWTIGWADPTGGAYSTAGDLTRFTEAVMGAWHGDYDYRDLASRQAGDVPQSANAEPVTQPYLPLSPPWAREFLSLTWYNRDGQTAWGRPWEILVGPAGYLLRSKDGGLPSYATQVTMVPELRLSLVAIWNSQLVPNIPFMAGAMQALIPALVETLIPLQPIPSLGPHGHGPYVGTYVAPSPEGVGQEPIDLSTITATVGFNESSELMTIALVATSADDGSTSPAGGPWALQYHTSIRAGQPSLVYPAPADVFTILVGGILPNGQPYPGLPPRGGCLVLQGQAARGDSVYFVRGQAGSPMPVPGAWVLDNAGHSTSATSGHGKTATGTDHAAGAGTETDLPVIGLVLPGLQEAEVYTRQGRR